MGVSGVQYLSFLETPRLFPTPMISVVQLPPDPLTSKGPVVDLVLLMFVMYTDSVQLLKTNWEETAWEEVAKARIVAVVRAVKCMAAVVDGCVVQKGAVRYGDSGGSGV